MSFTPGFGNGLPPKKRRTVTNSGPLGPRKRLRRASAAPSRPRKYHLEGKYCDNYRLLFNEVVQQAAVRFESDVASRQYYAWQIGASLWSRDEQATFYAALERLGKNDIPGIADAIGTKTIPETRALLLLLEDAAAKHSDVKVTLRDIPAALDVGNKCNEQLDLAAEALAWNQERYEARQEKDQFGDYWLITPAVAQEIEAAINSDQRPDPTAPTPTEGGFSKRGGKVITGACLACKKSKQKCDRKTPCGSCQKRKLAKCEYPGLPAGAEQTKTSGEPSEPRKQEHKSSTPDILKALPEATLLRPQVMLQLSKDVFMNRCPTIPSPWPHWSEYTSDIAQEPSMYRTAFGDFYNLVVSLTRRLVQTAIIQATMRLRSRVGKSAKSATGFVRKNDVRAAIDILRMQRNGKQRWIGVARRCALRVYDGQASRHRKQRYRREIPWDEVERTMNMASQTDDILTMDGETSDDYTRPRSEAVRSKTPLPLEDLALSDSDDSMLDEVAPIYLPRRQPRDLTGRYAGPSLAKDDERLAPQLISLEQFDHEASRREEEKMWTMLGLEPSQDDGDIDNDGEHDLSEDEKIITLPNGWRWWTDYHSEWEEFDTLPNPVKFMANQKPLTVPSVLHKHTTETADSSSDDFGDPTQARKQHQKERAVSELRTLSSRAYADQKIRALAQRELSSAGSSEDEGMSNGGSDKEEMDQPIQSVETDVRQAPLEVAEDVDINMTPELTVPINSRRKTRPPPRSDDELSEMDWNSFID